MMRRFPVRSGVLLTLLAALALTLTACGGGEKTVTVTVTQPAPTSEGKGGGNGKEGDPADVAPTNGAVAGYVDNVSVESDSMVLTGWAASKDLSSPATKVVAEVGGEAVAEAVPTLNRDDVVEALGKPGLKESGFELRLPLNSVECGSPAAGIKVIGSLDADSSVLSYGEGIKEAVTEAC